MSVFCGTMCVFCETLRGHVREQLLARFEKQGKKPGVDFAEQIDRELADLADEMFSLVSKKSDLESLLNPRDED